MVYGLWFMVYGLGFASAQPLVSAHREGKTLLPPCLFRSLCVCVRESE